MVKFIDFCKKKFVYANKYLYMKIMKKVGVDSEIYNYPCL